MLALILDRAHAFEEAARHDLAPAGDRPLVAVRAALSSIALPAPAGSRPCEGGRDFAFVVDRVVAPAVAWRPIRECNDATRQLYVELMLGGYEPPSRAVDVWSFGSGPEMAAQLVKRVTHDRRDQRVESAERRHAPIDPDSLTVFRRCSRRRGPWWPVGAR